MRKRIDINEIYTAALKVFSEYGYKKATVDDIARELGMTKGNLYFYASGKKDLYEKAVGFALIHWQTQVREAIIKEKSAREQLFVMCQKAIDYLDDAHELRNILKRDPDIFPMFPVQDPYEPINNDSVQMIRAILKAGIREGSFRSVDVEKVSAIIFSIYKMFIIRTYIKDTADKPHIRELFDETLSLMTRWLFITTE